MDNKPQPLSVDISRDAEVYHSCLRSSWALVLNSTLPGIHNAADARHANDVDLSETSDAEAFLAELPEYQIFSWFSRHGQRLRYYGGGGLGIFDQVQKKREYVETELNETAATAGDDLRLNPDLHHPDYLRWADFHQHRGGTWSDETDGVVYETARRLAFLTETGSRNIYNWSYSMIPDQPYERVLDWGAGHGAGILEWKRSHPDSECYGVDISAPCLKIAHRRAREEGFTIKFSQQDLEFLDFPDNHFDLAFHIFMFHEIPPKNLVAMLKEIYRVLKPGGRFCGPESCLSDSPEYLRVIQNTIPWLLDEVYFNAWHEFDLEYWAKEVGFSEVIVEPWAPAFKALEDSDDRQLNKWKYFQLVK